MKFDINSKIPSWLLVDNSVKSSIFCMSLAMIVLGLMVQFIIRISYVAESGFFFPLYFTGSLVLFTLGCIGAGLTTLLFICKAIKAIRHGVFIPWITDCIQDLNERPKLKLPEHVIKRQKEKEFQDQTKIAIDNYKRFSARTKKSGS